MLYTLYSVQWILEGVSKAGQLTGGQCFVEAPFWKQNIPYSRDWIDTTSEVIIQECSEMHYNLSLIRDSYSYLDFRLILDRFSPAKWSKNLKNWAECSDFKDGYPRCEIWAKDFLFCNSGCPHTIFFRIYSTIDHDQSIRYSLRKCYWHKGADNKLLLIDPKGRDNSNNVEIFKKQYDFPLIFQTCFDGTSCHRQCNG